MKDKIAKILLEKKAVTLNAKEPYTYVSGIRSPIYCDNRLLTFYPEERSEIVAAFVEKVKELSPEIIAGTASSAISWAAWIAHELKMPMVYIRKKGKGYGQNRLIEGGDIKDKKVVVIEDLVSTGGSSLNAVESCKDAGGDVVGMVAIFTYGFNDAQESFFEKGCRAEFLTDFSTLIDVAGKEGLLEQDEIETVRQWNKDPSGWGPANGFPLGEKKN